MHISPVGRKHSHIPLCAISHKDFLKAEYENLKLENFQNSIWTNFPTIFFMGNDTYIQIASGHDCGSVLPLNITCNLTLISQALWDVFQKMVTIFVWRLDRKAENWPSQLYLLGQTSKKSNSHIELQFQLRPPLFCLVCIHFNSRNNF